VGGGGNAVGGGSDGAAVVGVGVAVTVVVAAVVVAALVATQGLSGGETLVTDGTLVHPSADGGGGNAVVGDDGDRGGFGRGLAVAGLVSTERLIRRKGLVANGAPVR